MIDLHLVTVAESRATMGYIQAATREEKERFATHLILLDLVRDDLEMAIVTRSIAAIRRHGKKCT